MSPVIAGKVTSEFQELNHAHLDLVLKKKLFKKQQLMPKDTRVLLVV
jgi:hypothetical protein